MPNATIPARYHRVEEVRAEYGDELVDRILRGAALSDEPADRLVEAFRALPGGVGWAMLDEALTPGMAVTGELTELTDLLTPILDPPSWINFDLVDAGAVAWMRVGALPQILALMAGSLAYGYSSPGFARPLVRTGRLTQMASRRLAETAQWEVLIAEPGTLRPGGAGLRATVRLRLMHSLVRAHLLRQGDWDIPNWGMPISVTDTLATGVVGHFIYPLRGLRDLGVRYTAAEREAITHLWTWISFVLGVPEDYLPRSYAEADTFYEAARKLDAGAIPESRELEHALLFHSLPLKRLPQPVATLARLVVGHVIGATARRWMGDENADTLAIPDTALKYLVGPALRPLVHARDIVRATGVLGSDERLAAFERTLWSQLVAATGFAGSHIQPEHIEREPVLSSGRAHSADSK